VRPFDIEGQGHEIHTDATGRLDDAVGDLLDDLRDWGSAAVTRAKTSVQAEHQTNAAARGKPAGAAKAPGDDRIDLAFAQQLGDIGRIGRQRFLRNA
jgi:hypothetical protein